MYKDSVELTTGINLQIVDIDMDGSVHSDGVQGQG